MAFSFTTFLADVGIGLGAFLNTIMEPLVTMILVLGIMGSIFSLIHMVSSRVKYNS